METGRGSHQPEGTRANPGPRPAQNATATRTRPPATPTYGGQSTRGTCTPRARGHPAPRLRTVGPHPAVSPGPRHAPLPARTRTTATHLESRWPRPASITTRLRTPGPLTTPIRDNSGDGPQETRIGAGRAGERPANRAHPAEHSSSPTLIAHPSAKKDNRRPPPDRRRNPLHQADSLTRADRTRASSLLRPATPSATPTSVPAPKISRPPWTVTNRTRF